MKKRNNLKAIDISVKQNPVAKFAHRFNSAKTFNDKTKYTRKAKHIKQEAFPIPLTRAMGNAFCLRPGF